jgi:hypothetical protein
MHPDWDDPTQLLVYGDWLEEQGRDAELATLRWLTREGRRPQDWPEAELFGWAGTKIFRLGEHPFVLPEELLALLESGKNTNWTRWKDYHSVDDALNAVLAAAAKHPTKVLEIINANAVSAGGPDPR